MPTPEESVIISEYLIKYLQDNCTEEERLLVEQWLEKPANKKFFHSLVNDNASTILTFKEINKNKARKALNKALNKKERENWKIVFRWIAASIIVFVSLSYLFLLNDTSKSDSIVKTASIEKSSPIHDKPILFTSSGEKIILEDKDIFSKINKIEKNHKDDSLFPDRPEKIKYNTIVVPRNSEFFFVLSDGTRVWLNSDTKIKYPIKFIGKERKIFLTGEAFFNVTKDIEHPFIVKNDDFDIKVLGTQFNVKAYPNENKAATLVKGSIQINNNEILSPNEQAVLCDGNIEIRKVDPFIYTAWKDGCFVFYKASLDDILKQLSGWYDFEYFYQNNELRDEIFTAKFKKYDSINNVLKILEVTKNVKFRKKGKSITVMK